MKKQKDWFILAAQFAMISLFCGCIIGALLRDIENPPDPPATIRNEYEVLSIAKRTDVTTNQFGGVLWEDEYYEIMIEGSSGHIESVDYDGEIKLGDRDLYVTEHLDGTANYHRSLYLTKETLKGL